MKKTRIINGKEYKRIATFDEWEDAESKAKRYNGIILTGRNGLGVFNHEVYRVYVEK